MTDTLPMNFLGLETRDSQYEHARYVIWPIGYDATTSYRTGTRDGPVAIIAASRQIELFDPDLGHEIHRPGVATLNPFDPDVSSPDATLDAVSQQAGKILAKRKFLLVLGGEHSISFALIRAHARRRKTFSVLHIDAHLDMRDRYQGSPFSHACVIRRVHELGIPTVSVGIRSVALEEHRYVKKNRCTVHTAEALHSARDDVTSKIVDALTDRVYITIDMVTFDPAYAPGVGTPEPGGLDWYTVLNLLRQVAQTRQIIGADVVETLPVPGQVTTEFLAAKLTAKIIALTQH